MLRIKGWADKQHYKDRMPPWIKLHRTLLDDYDWHCLSSDSKALAISLWLLACEHEDIESGIIEDDPKRIAFRVRMDEKTVVQSIKQLIQHGFVANVEDEQPDLLAPCYQDATPETETETEAYSKEAKAETKESIEIPSFIDSDTWLDYVKHRGGSKFTKLMATRIIKQLAEWNEKGHNVNDILDRSIMNGWKGVFEPDNKKGKTNEDPKEELARFLDKRAERETS